jgi:hypothetical protein
MRLAVATSPLGNRGYTLEKLARYNRTRGPSEGDEELT